MLTLLNQSLAARRIDGQYISIAYAVWDDNSRILRVANSGLPRPLHCHEGHVERVESVGLPLGLFDDPTYDEVTFNATPGDVFVFFSDGVTDAQNREGDQFGSIRLGEVIEKSCALSAAEMVLAIFAAVAEFTAGENQYDDQTVVVLKILERSGKNK